MEDKMMKISMVLFVMIFYYSCINTTSKVVDTNNKSISQTEPLNKYIATEIDMLRAATTSKEIGNLQIDSLIIAVKFENNVKHSEVIGADSAVYISYFDSNIDLSGYIYKGVLKLDKYKVAIFDKGGVGAPFYDRQEIELVPLPQLFKPKIDFVVISAMQIKKDSLIKWVSP